MPADTSHESSDLEQFRRDAETRLRLGLHFDSGVAARWPGRVGSLVEALEELDKIRTAQPDRFEETSIAFHQSPVGRIAKQCALIMIGFMHSYGRWDGLTDYEHEFTRRYYAAFPHLRPAAPVGRPIELPPHFHGIARKYKQFAKLLEDLKRSDTRLRREGKKAGRIHRELVRRLLHEDEIAVPWPLWAIDSPGQQQERDALEVAQTRFLRDFQRLVSHLHNCGLLADPQFQNRDTFRGALFAVISELLGYRSPGRHSRPGAQQWFCERMARATGTSIRTVAKRISDDRPGKS